MKYNDKELTEQIIKQVRDERVLQLEEALTAIYNQNMNDHGWDADCMVDEIMRIAHTALFGKDA